MRCNATESAIAACVARALGLALLHRRSYRHADMAAPRIADAQLASEHLAGSCPAVASIVAFSIHAACNKRLAENEVGEWVLEFVVFIPFGMLSCWNKHVWDQPRLETSLACISQDAGHAALEDRGGDSVER